jgi:hypothetical protein
MPDRCCHADYDALFDARSARRELTAYRRKGATGSTRRLLDAIRAEGVAGMTVLDIGGGVGVIGAELLADGASSVTDVDASRAYIAVAGREMSRRGLGERVSLRHGDFVRLADEIPPADVVTLNRVICCYPDWPSLVGRSLERSRRLYGIVYPRDRWFLRAGVAFVRAVGRLTGTVYPVFVHPEAQIDATIRAAGFVPTMVERGFVWQALVYRRLS